MGIRHFHMHPEDERRQWQNSESILSLAGLKPGMTFIDLGCGNGFCGHATILCRSNRPPEESTWTEATGI